MMIKFLKNRAIKTICFLLIQSLLLSGCANTITSFTYKDSQSCVLSPKVRIDNLPFVKDFTTIYTKSSLTGLSKIDSLKSSNQNLIPNFGQRFAKWVSHNKKRIVKSIIIPIAALGILLFSASQAAGLTTDYTKGTANLTSWTQSHDTVWQLGQKLLQDQNNIEKPASIKVYKMCYEIFKINKDKIIGIDKKKLEALFDKQNPSDVQIIKTVNKLRYMPGTFSISSLLTKAEEKKIAPQVEAVDIEEEPMPGEEANLDELQQFEAESRGFKIHQSDFKPKEKVEKDRGSPVGKEALEIFPENGVSSKNEPVISIFRSKLIGMINLAKNAMFTTRPNISYSQNTWLYESSDFQENRVLEQPVKRSVLQFQISQPVLPKQNVILMPFNGYVQLLNDNDGFKSGQPVMKIIRDEIDYLKNESKAESELREKQLIFEQKKALFQSKRVSALALLNAKEEYEEAKTRLAQIKKTRSYIISFSFDGRIVQAFSGWQNKGSEFIKVFNLQDKQLNISMSAKQEELIRKGYLFTLSYNENPISYKSLQIKDNMVTVLIDAPLLETFKQYEFSMDFSMPNSMTAVPEGNFVQSSECQYERISELSAKITGILGQGSYFYQGQKLLPGRVVGFEYDIDNINQQISALEKRFDNQKKVIASMEKAIRENNQQDRPQTVSDLELKFEENKLNYFEKQLTIARKALYQINNAPLVVDWEAVVIKPTIFYKNQEIKQGEALLEVAQAGIMRTEIELDSSYASMLYYQKTLKAVIEGTKTTVEVTVVSWQTIVDQNGFRKIKVRLKIHDPSQKLLPGQKLNIILPGQKELESDFTAQDKKSSLGSAAAIFSFLPFIFGSFKKPRRKNKHSLSITEKGLKISRRKFIFDGMVAFAGFLCGCTPGISLIKIKSEQELQRKEKIILKYIPFYVSDKNADIVMVRHDDLKELLISRNGYIQSETISQLISQLKRKRLDAPEYNLGMGIGTDGGFTLKAQRKVALGDNFTLQVSGYKDLLFFLGAITNTAIIESLSGGPDRKKLRSQIADQALKIVIDEFNRFILDKQKKTAGIFWQIKKLEAKLIGRKKELLLYQADSMKLKTLWENGIISQAEYLKTHSQTIRMLQQEISELNNKKQKQEESLKRLLNFGVSNVKLEQFAHKGILAEAKQLISNIEKTGKKKFFDAIDLPFIKSLENAYNMQLRLFELSKQEQLPSLLFGAATGAKDLAQDVFSDLGDSDSSMFSIDLSWRFGKAVRIERNISALSVLKQEQSLKNAKAEQKQQFQELFIDIKAAYEKVNELTKQKKQLQLLLDSFESEIKAGLKSEFENEIISQKQQLAIIEADIAIAYFDLALHIDIYDLYAQRKKENISQDNAKIIRKNALLAKEKKLFPAFIYIFVSIAGFLLGAPSSINAAQVFVSSQNSIGLQSEAQDNKNIYSDSVIKQRLLFLTDTTQLFNQISKLGEQGRINLLRSIVKDSQMLPRAREWAFLELSFNNDLEGMFAAVNQMHKLRLFESDDIKNKRLFSFLVRVLNEYLLKTGASLYNELLKESEDSLEAVDTYLCFLMQTDLGNASEVVLTQLRQTNHQEAIIERLDNKGLLKGRLLYLVNDLAAKDRGIDFLKLRKKNGIVYEFQFIKAFLAKLGLYDEVILRDEQILENYLKKELLNVACNLNQFAGEFSSKLGSYGDFAGGKDGNLRQYKLTRQSNISRWIIICSGSLDQSNSYLAEIARLGSAVLSKQLQIYQPDVLYVWAKERIKEADLIGVADISSELKPEQKQVFLKTIINQSDLSFISRAIDTFDEDANYSDIKRIKTRLFLYELLSALDGDDTKKASIINQALLLSYNSGFSLGMLASAEDYLFQKFSKKTFHADSLPYLAGLRLEKIIALEFLSEQKEFYKAKSQNGIWLKRNQYQEKYEKLQIFRQKVQAVLVDLKYKKALSSLLEQAEKEGLVKFSFNDVTEYSSRLKTIFKGGGGGIWDDRRGKALGKSVVVIGVFAGFIFLINHLLKRMSFLKSSMKLYSVKNRSLLKRFIGQSKFIGAMLGLWYIVFGRDLLTRPVIEIFVKSRPDQWSKFNKDLNETTSGYQFIVFWHMMLNIVFINVMVFLEVLPGLWNLTPIFIGLIFTEQVMEVIKHRKRVVLGKLFFSRFAAFVNDEIKFFSMKRGFNESRLEGLPGLKLAEYAMGKISIIYSQESFFISVSIFLGLLAFNWITAFVFLGLIGILFAQFKLNIHRHTSIQKAVSTHKQYEVGQMNDFAFNTDFRIPFNKQKDWQDNVQDKEDILIQQIMRYVRKSRTIAVMLPGLGMLFNIPLTSVAMTKNLESTFFLHELVYSVSNAFNAEKALYGFAKEIEQFMRYNNYQKTGKERDIMFPHKLEIENVSIRIPHTGLNIIENISLNLPIGQMVLLEGDSGEGKTILGQTIAGEDNRLMSGGKIRIFGKTKKGIFRYNNDQRMEYVQFFAVNDAGVYSIKKFLEKLETEKQQNLFFRILRYAGIDLEKRFIDAKKAKETFPDKNVRWKDCFQKTPRGEYAVLPDSGSRVNGLITTDNKKTELLQLIDQAKSKEFHQLSEGQRNRVKIAFFVLFFKDAPVYILDQPFSVVDKQATVFFLKFLRSVAEKEKKLIIIIEPKITQARNLFHACLKIENGILIDTTPKIKLVETSKGSSIVKTPAKKSVNVAFPDKLIKPGKLFSASLIKVAI